MPRPMQPDREWDLLFAQFNVNLLAPLDGEDPHAEERAANRAAWVEELARLEAEGE